jgi:hypothetical protein
LAMVIASSLTEGQVGTLGIHHIKAHTLPTKFRRTVALQEKQCLVREVAWRCGADSYLPCPLSILPNPLVWDQVHKETSGFAVVAKC